jgi:hypothetical protein
LKEDFSFAQKSQRNYTKKMSTERATAKRVTSSIIEADYWDFSQDVLVIDPDLKEKFESRWKIFSKFIQLSITSKLTSNFSGREVLEETFEPRFPQTVFGTTFVLGEELNMPLVLNADNKFLSNRFTKSQYTIAFTNLVVGEVLLDEIYHVFESCILEVASVSINYIAPKFKDDVYSKIWTLVSNNEKDRSVKFEMGEFKVNIIPCLKVSGGQYFLIKMKEGTLIPITYQVNSGLMKIYI